MSQSNNSKLNGIHQQTARSNKNLKPNASSQSSYMNNNNTLSSSYYVPYYQNQNAEANQINNYQNSSQFQSGNYNFYPPNSQYFTGNTSMLPSSASSQFAAQNNKLNPNRPFNPKQQSQTSTPIHSLIVDSHKTKLYVTNFPEDMDQDEMKKLFSQHGDVLECTIMWNQYAFVHFSSIEQADKAMTALKG